MAARQNTGAAIAADPEIQGFSEKQEISARSMGVKNVKAIKPDPEWIRIVKSVPAPCPVAMITW